MINTSPSNQTANQAPIRTNPYQQTTTTPALDGQPMSADNSNPVLVQPLIPKQKDSMRKLNSTALVIMALAVVAGVGTGFGLNKMLAKSSSLGGSKQPMATVATGTVNNGDVFGSNDESTFKDSVEGYLQAGGLDGEGSHHLLRPGGDSQTVYLTSSVTDLDKFVGMEVKVWGETFKGQQAGWLMDVGRVQVNEVAGVSPVED